MNKKLQKSLTFAEVMNCDSGILSHFTGNEFIIRNYGCKENLDLPANADG